MSSREVLFIAGTHGYEASTILFSGVRAFGYAEDKMETLTQIIALFGLARVPSRTGVWPISDLFIGPSTFPAEAKRIRDIAEYVAQNRALKWEDEVQRLINSGDVNTVDLKEMDIKPPMLARFAEQIGQRFAAASTTR